AVLVRVKLVKEIGDFALGFGLADLAVLVGVHLFQEFFHHAVDLRILVRILFWLLVIVIAKPLAHDLKQALDFLLIELAVVISVETIENPGQAGWHLVLAQNAVFVPVEMLDEIVRAPLEQQGNKRRHLVSFLLLGRILIAGETGSNKK